MRSMMERAMLLCAVVVAGCSAGSDTTAPKRSAAVDVSLASSGAGSHVTGSATILLPDFGNAVERYSLSAIRHADGSVSGQFEETSEQDGGQRIHASVYCFTVVGNSARLAAQLDQSNVPFGPVGSYVIWSLTDNGEGAKSPPDVTTDIFFGASEAVAAFHCRTGVPLTPYYPSIRGNLQVK